MQVMGESVKNKFHYKADFYCGYCKHNFTETYTQITQATDQFGGTIRGVTTAVICPYCHNWHSHKQGFHVKEVNKLRGTK